MEKLQSKLSDWNVREVQRIKTLIRDFCKTPDLILLYGNFVDDTPRQFGGGYEFLVVISNADMVEREELQAYIREKYPAPERYVTALSVFVVSTEFFRANVRKVPYLNDIYKNGIELHNCAPRLWEPVNERRAVKQKDIRAIQEKINRCSYISDGMIEASGQMEVHNNWDICPFFLYHAVEQLCMGAEYKYYGFVREFNHISRRFDAIKYSSKRLYEYADTKRNILSKMFKTLTKQRRTCLYGDNFGYPAEAVEKYTDIIQEIQEILENDNGTADGHTPPDQQGHAPGEPGRIEPTTA